MRNGDIYRCICTFVKKGIAYGTQSTIKSTVSTATQNPTKEEHILWQGFLRRYPHQFRRQYIIGNYIVDFFCHKAQLVVELDGSQHYLSQGRKRDTERTRYLQAQGLTVIRFSNADVLQNFDGICQAIDMAVKEKLPF